MCMFTALLCLLEGEQNICDKRNVFASGNSIVNRLTRDDQSIDQDTQSDSSDGTVCAAQVLYGF